jgi:hypothetical protein
VLGAKTFEWLCAFLVASSLNGVVAAWWQEGGKLLDSFVTAALALGTAAATVLAEQRLVAQ